MICTRLMLTRWLFGLLAAYVAAAALLIAMPHAQAQSLDAALAQFTEDSFDDTDQGIQAVVASGSPRASPIIQALADGRLVYDGDKKKVYIKTETGVLDAETGQPVTSAPDNLDAVRLNNRLRQAVAAALGGLTLMSPDRAARLSAAQAVFKSRDEKVLPVVETALAKETDAGIKTILTQARAAILLGSEEATEPQKIEAVAAIAARGDQDALRILNDIPADAPPAFLRRAIMSLYIWRMPAKVVVLVQSSGRSSSNQPLSRNSCPWKIMGIPGAVKTSPAARVERFCAQ